MDPGQLDHGVDSDPFQLGLLILFNLATQGIWILVNLGTQWIRILANEAIQFYM